MLKYTLMLLGSRLVRVLPLWFAYLIASIGAFVAYAFIPSRRRKLAENIALASGIEDPREAGRLVRSAYRHMAKNTVDFLMFPSLSAKRVRRMTRSAGMATLDRELARGRGVIFITSHLGHWEFGGALLASLGYPTVVITESIAPKKSLLEKDKKIASLFREFREKAGMTVIPMERIMTRVVRALRAGKILVFVSDRDITGHGVPVSFFGKRCRLPRGPAFFSLRMGAPIVPGYLVREKDGVYLGAIMEPIDSAGRACDEDGVLELTQKVAGALEKMISKYPDQWFVFESVGEKSDS